MLHPWGSIRLTVPRYVMLALFISIVFMGVFLLLTGLALADTPGGAPPAGQTIALGLPVWSIAVGALVPLVTYVLNRLSASEPVAAFVLLLATTIAGALTQLVDAGSVGFDANTLKYVLSAVAAALAAHHLIWKPGGINTKLGGGVTVPRYLGPPK